MVCRASSLPRSGAVARGLGETFVGDVVINARTESRQNGLSGDDRR